jgi:hypothetical protein
MAGVSIKARQGCLRFLAEEVQQGNLQISVKSAGEMTRDSCDVAPRGNRLTSKRGLVRRGEIVSLSSS